MSVALLCVARMKPKTFRYLVVILQGLCGLVLLLAGFEKVLFSIEPAMRLLNSIGIRPTSTLHVLLRAWGSFEFVLGIVLVFGLVPRLAATLLACALSLLTSLLVYAGFRTGWLNECGCNFVMTSSTIKFAVIRNIVLLTGSIALARFVFKERRAKCISVTERAHAAVI